MDHYTLVQRLCDANGISGFEDDVLLAIREEAAGLGDFEEDALRNLYLHRSGNDESKPTILLDAHTDEVGFMVRSIRDDGMLEFIPIGGWVAANVGAHLVRVIGENGESHTGVVGSKPPHYASEEERKRSVELSSLYIDVGAQSAHEVRSWGIEIGCPIVPEAMVQRMKGSTIIGKAFDCRLGCASIIQVLNSLKGQKLNVNLVASFASQEEVGLRGANVAARRIKPDVAICFEGSPADDTFLAPYQQQTRLASGPMLRHIDRTMITNPRFQRYCLDLAQQLEIPVQRGVRDGGGTNAGAIHLSEQGIPTVVLGIPVRYAHTHWGVASLDDVESTIRLGVAIAANLDRKTIDAF